MIPDFLNLNTEYDSKFNEYGIEFRSDIDLNVREPKIKKDNSKIEVEFEIKENIEEHIYIEISDESNYEEAEIKIELDKNIVVNGNVFININGRIKGTEVEFELDQGASIIGDIFITGTGSEIQIEFDKGSSIKGNIYISGKFKEIEIELSEEANITGNIHSNAEIKDEFEIELKESAFISGNIYSDAKVEFEFEIEGKGTINGVIFVPNSILEFDHGIKVNGAVIGKEVKVKDGNITYNREYIKSSVLDIPNASFEHGHGYEGYFK